MGRSVRDLANRKPSQQHPVKASLKGRLAGWIRFYAVNHNPRTELSKPSKAQCIISYLGDAELWGLDELVAEDDGLMVFAGGFELSVGASQRETTSWTIAATAATAVKIVA